jgi:hypothetical protein
MIVDKIKQCSPRDGACYYELTIRVWPRDLEEPSYEYHLGELVLRAVRGIDSYPDQVGKKS